MLGNEITLINSGTCQKVEPQLTDSGHADSSHPVVVEMGQKISEFLHLVRLEASCVLCITQ